MATQGAGFSSYNTAGAGTYSPPYSYSTNSADADNLSRSIFITVLILAIAVILSAILYLFIRCVNRCRSRSETSQLDSDHAVHRRHRQHNNIRHQPRQSSSRRVTPEENSNSVIDWLPLFTFESIGRVSSGGGGGDCAVCLSKFEPHDQLRLLPICCHAFHAECVDTWLATNQTCPLCRSPIVVSESEILNRILVSNSSSRNNSGSFRIEIGNVSRRGLPSGEQRRSYSMGEYDYIIDEVPSEVSLASTTTRRASDLMEKNDVAEITPEPPGQSVAAEVAPDGRGWLKDYVDRWRRSTSMSLSSSFRSSGRFFTGSSRRTTEFAGVNECDLEASRLGYEISEWFRWAGE